MNQLTIFTIATGRYLNYWFNLVESANKFLDKQLNVQWILLTDQEEKVQANRAVISDLNLLIKPIENLDWPLPTILRYEFIENFKSSIAGDHIMYLDSDMLFIKNVTKSYLLSQLSSRDIAFTNHPGFYRPNGFQLFQFYLRNPIYLIKDLRLYIGYGGLGTWERNKQSNAYVGRRFRSKYVCGGVWFGKTPSIIKMCIELSLRVKIDFENQIVAVHHDESHLNWFASNYSFDSIKPNLCFDPTYPQLRNIDGLILAVDKGENAR